MSGPLVLTTDHGAVRLLSLNRPEVLNAFDSALYRAGADALAAARADDSVKAVVLTGTGRAFSAGQDLGEMARLASGEATFSEFPAFVDELCGFDKPLLAAVNGVGLGIGFTLLAHCDVVVMAEGARLRTPFAELGVAPEAASSVLFPARLGWQRAAHVLFSGAWVSAAEAVEWGLAIEVAAPEAVVGRTIELAAEMSTGPLEALRAIKSTMLAPHAAEVAAARAREDAAFERLLIGRTT